MKCSQCSGVGDSMDGLTTICKKCLRTLKTEKNKFESIICHARQIAMGQWYTRKGKLKPTVKNILDALNGGEIKY